MCLVDNSGSSRDLTLNGRPLVCETFLALVVGELNLVESLVLSGGVLLGQHGIWVCADGGVDFFDSVLQVFGSESFLNVSSIVGTVRLRVLGLQLGHVVCNVPCEKVFPEDLGLELLSLCVIPNEPRDGVGDIQPTVCGSLHGSENFTASSCSPQTNIQKA